MSKNLIEKQAKVPVLFYRKEDTNYSETYEQIFNFPHNYRSMTSSKVDSIFTYIVRDQKNQ